MCASLDAFLNWLRPLNDAGLINTLGVIATFLAVLVALAPSFGKWKNRPKFVVLLKPVAIENIAGNKQQPPKITSTSVVLLKNTGRSAALKVRAVITDLYGQGSNGFSFQWRDMAQKTISSDEDLPAGLCLQLTLVWRKQIGEFDTGFMLGKSKAISLSTYSNPAVGAILPPRSVMGLDDPLQPATYIIRVVVSANNTTPKSRLIRVELTHEIKVRFAGWRERRAIKKADRRRAV